MDVNHLCWSVVRCNLHIQDLVGTASFEHQHVPLVVINFLHFCMLYKLLSLVEP
jgi:hypothetical protein